MMIEKLLRTFCVCASYFAVVWTLFYILFYNYISVKCCIYTTDASNND